MGKVEVTFIEDEMEQSYIDYAISVIRGRAIPDVRDGLKPVQRRILYTMRELGLTPGKPHKKSARIVGETLGKYHPHGDMAVYEALVNMAQPFSTRYPLVDGQGNFGSVDGDEPAAMRYTEARLAPIAMEFFEELSEETVEFIPNFDDSLKEPEVLPAKFPHILANGAWGISVGMTTQIPPHNLRELIQATLYVLDHPDATVEELLPLMPGPDFPTGGLIVGREGIRKAYATGEGRLRVRGKAFVEDGRIVITEIPYLVKKSSLLESIAAKVKSGEIEGIADLRDESDREGLRVVVELKRGADPERVLFLLYKLTPLERTYSCHFLVILDGAPRVLSLPELLRAFLDFRRRVVERRTRYRLRQARERAEILEGFRKALERLDEVVEIVRTSRDTEEAKVLLVAEVGLSDRQADAVLKMRLSQLTRMERHGVERELADLEVKIAEYEAILADPRRLDAIIREELQGIAEKYGDERRTQIVEEVEEALEEPRVPRREVLVAVTAKGYVNLVERDAFRSQGRGGKGVIGIRTRGDDYLRALVYAHTHQELLIFTDMAKVFRLPLERLPIEKRDSRGKNLRQFLEIDLGEEIRAVLPVEDYGKGYCLFATRRGIVNRNPLSDYANAHSKGIIAHTAVDEDRLVEAVVSRGRGEVMLFTAQGKAIRFREEEVRITHRPSKGVIGIRLEGDAVVGMVWWPEDAPPESLLLVTAAGYGKRISPTEFPLQGRGGKGVIGIKLDRGSGPLVGAVPAPGGSEALVSTAKGKVIRFPVDQVSTFSRYARGVRLMRLDPGDRVASVVVL
ncbi:MAG TPA: DNA gyrase subunit A [Candidatus Acetothermia bacterium]|nr:DNA gyrase subunit A [Candidatus Acetothermia bacterium]